MARVGASGLNLVHLATADLTATPGALDDLHASLELLGRNRTVRSDADLEWLTQAYEIALNAPWEDELDEKDWTLARIAFLAWNQCRLAEDYPATKRWQRVCCEHTLAQEHIANFLEIPYVERSAQLNERYLTDEAVLLAACDRLERERNRSPREVARDGANLYEWVSTEAVGYGMSGEFVSFIKASVALWVFASHHMIGNPEGSRRWSRRAEAGIAECLGSAPLAAVFEHLRLSNLYWSNSFQEALRHIDCAIAEFERLRMGEAAVRSRFLKGILLKELNDLDSALDQLWAVERRAAEIHDNHLASIALANCAQIVGSQGRFNEAIELAKRALEKAEESQVPGAMAFAHGTVGELLRDIGDFRVAVEAYALGVRLYDLAGMDGMASYSRVLAAEALLLDSRPLEAASEILAALPTIETHGLTQEGAAAVAILKESIRRQQADPAALRQLREQLQLMRRQGKL